MGEFPSSFLLKMLLANNEMISMKTTYLVGESFSRQHDLIRQHQHSPIQ